MEITVSEINTTFYALIIAALLWGALLCLIASVFLLTASMKGEKTKQRLIPLMLSCAVGLLGYALALYCTLPNANSDPAAVIAGYLVWLLCHAVLLPLAYAFHIKETLPKSKLYRILFVFLLALPVLTAAALGILQVLGWLYTVSEPGVYSRFFLFRLCQIPTLLFVLICAVVLIRQRHKLSRLCLSGHLAFLILLLASAVLRCFHPALDCSPFAAAAAALTLFCAVMLEPAAQEKISVPLSDDPPQTQRNQREKQLEIVLSQLRPFFLTRCINCIFSLCGSNPPEAKKALAALSDYLQICLDTLDDNSTVTFQLEYELVESYFSLEKLRYPNINLVCDLKEKGFSLPAMTVQPLVENAVRHGISRKPEGGTVWLSTEETERDYLVRIRDNGGGMDPFSLRADDPTRTGIRNIRERLAVLCGGYLEIQSRKPFGVEAVIHIPKKRFF